jgi:hypothetical protein
VDEDRDFLGDLEDERGDDAPVSFERMMAEGRAQTMPVPPEGPSEDREGVLDREGDKGSARPAAARQALSPRMRAKGIVCAVLQYRDGRRVVLR